MSIRNDMWNDPSFYEDPFEKRRRESEMKLWKEGYRMDYNGAYSRGWLEPVYVINVRGEIEEKRHKG